MFNKINFRVLIQRNDNGAMYVASILRGFGAFIYDLRESEIVDDVDKSVVSEVYVLCCKGNKKVFNKVKELYETEIEYEGFRTLL